MEEKSLSLTPPRSPTAAEDKRSTSPSAVLTAATTATTSTTTTVGVAEVAGVAPGCVPPANLYGATSAPYSNHVLISNSGVAVPSGANAVAGTPTHSFARCLSRVSSVGSDL